MSAFAGNVLDAVLGVGEERYKKVLRRPLHRQRARHCCAGSREGGNREGAAMSASAGNVLDTVLGVGEEEYEMMRR